MDDLDICGRCLVNPNMTTYVVAIWETRGSINRERAPNHANPRALKQWAEDRLYGDGARFEIDATINRIVAISTWHGDPVCSYHLWLLAESENKG